MYINTKLFLRHLHCMLYGIVLLGVASCENNTNQENVNVTTNEKVDVSITEADIDKLEFIDYLLSDSAKDATENWLEYNELNTQIESIKNGDLSLFNTDLESLELLIFDLKLNIPSSLSTKAIKARILALENNLMVGHDLFSLNGELKQEKLQAIKDIFIAMSNLNLQINKKFELDQNNFYNN